MKATASEKITSVFTCLVGFLFFLQQNHFLKLNQTQAKSSNEAKKRLKYPCRTTQDHLHVS
jgi:hypothetical protein